MRKLLATTIALVAGMTFTTGALAVVPDVIPVQGVLADSDDVPVDGLVDMTFALYTAETLGTSLWTDTFADVDVDAGFFTVYLGSGAALDFYTLLDNDEIWLGVTIEEDDEMERFRFYSVPFTQEALVCERVGSLTETDINTNFLASDYLPSWTSLTDIPGGFSDNTDDGFTDEAALTSLLDDNYAAAGHDHDSDYAPISHSHAWGDLTGVPSDFTDGTDDIGVGGGGTTDYLAKFTDATTVGNSAVFEDSGNVGIGTTSPTAELDVNGDAYVAGTLSIDGRFAQSPYNHYYTYLMTVVTTETHFFDFSTDSVGWPLLVEVTLNGYRGDQSSDTNSKKWAANCAFGDSTTYQKDITTIYSLGEEAANLTLDVIPYGSGNDFRVGITNNTGGTFHAAVNIHILTPFPAIYDF